MKLHSLTPKEADMLDDRQIARYVVRRRSQRQRDMEHIAKHLELPNASERAGGRGKRPMQPGNPDRPLGPMPALFLIGLAIWLLALLLAIAALVALVRWVVRGIWGS
ncbi:MAG TPA: hypothetical protein VGU71_22465 [Candidatus Dormibacteraeota bacterium]|nr:hypothetical protein [Candidatus Dormibacteraeota bacterium]